MVQKRPAQVKIHWRFIMGYYASFDGCFIPTLKSHAASLHYSDFSCLMKCQFRWVTQSAPEKSPGSAPALGQAVLASGSESTCWSNQRILLARCCTCFHESLLVIRLDPARWLEFKENSVAMGSPFSDCNPNRQPKAPALFRIGPIGRLL